MQASLGWMSGQRPVASVLLLALFLTVPGAGVATEPGAGTPWLAAVAGERLEYRVRWGVLNVGRAVLEVEGAAAGTVVLRATARTRGWIDPIYPVRDRVESTVLAAELRPLRLDKRTKEGHGKAERVQVEFDREAGVARYAKDGEPREPLPLPGEYQDPLSCIYAYRALAPGAEGEVDLQVTDGKRMIAGSFREVGRERVRTPAGEFDTVIVEPSIEGLGGVFRKSKKAKLVIWFTDDARRRPVRLYREVAGGRCTMELAAAD